MRLIIRLIIQAAQGDVYSLAAVGAIVVIVAAVIAVQYMKSQKAKEDAAFGLEPPEEIQK